MKKISAVLRVFLCATLLVGYAAAAERRAHFVEPKEIDAQKILNGPTAPDSADTRREIEIVLAKQAARTPADEARATREGTWSPYLFDDVLGVWFTEKNLPVTAAFLDTVGRDTMAVCEAAKKFWSRPRPPLQDPRVHPSVGLPTSTSYPSGHGAYGLVLGAVLAELAPDLKEKLIQRGEAIGDDRVIGGVHFPSDVEAGRALGRAVLAQLQTNPAYRAALEKAKVEFIQVRPRQRANRDQAGAR